MRGRIPPRRTSDNPRRSLYEFFHVLIFCANTRELLKRQFSFLLSPIRSGRGAAAGGYLADIAAQGFKGAPLQVCVCGTNAYLAKIVLSPKWQNIQFMRWISAGYMRGHIRKISRKYPLNIPQISRKYPLYPQNIP